MMLPGVQTDLYGSGFTVNVSGSDIFNFPFLGFATNFSAVILVYFYDIANFAFSPPAPPSYSRPPSAQS